ncbi:hypothetical protein [Sedimentibacter sp.]|uniref:hypothetical protein n=1 Tax=Sedimentibacter sp. TaxID=1960295 RepID=UPI0028A8CB92|nr:hypothetical protein [Sedimentibacter sp.]
MKKYLIFMVITSMLLCSCNQRMSNNVSNEAPIEDNTKKEPEADYSKVHEFTVMNEKYAWGYDLNESTPITYAMCLLVDLNKQDKFVDDSTITIPHEAAKEIASLFLDKELIKKGSYNGNYFYPLPKYPDISLEPFEISDVNGQINILYGRFVNNNDGSKHWLYPVRYTAVPYILAEEDIPDILSDIYEAGEQMYRIIYVENIYDIDSAKEIYTNNGYGELLVGKSYDISSPEDVVEMSKRVNSGLYSEICSTYNLMCDIDMNGIDFMPMGKYPDYMEQYDLRRPNKIGFCGILYGNNHSINNLNIAAEADESEYMNNYCGFFSILGQEAEVRDLSIINADIENMGENYSVGSGILAGRIYGSKIENCYVSGTVKGTVLVGGLAGESYGGDKLNGEELRCEIIKCNADVEVFGESWIGGFVGSNGADIVNCSVKGIVTSDEIEDYKRSSLENMPFGIGGFTGFNSGHISNSGSGVWVKAMVNVKWVGSFIGYSQGDGDAYECFYNSTVSHWDPYGLSLRYTYNNDITGLPNKEYYARLAEIEEMEIINEAE